MTLRISPARNSVLHLWRRGASLTTMSNVLSDFLLKQGFRGYYILPVSVLEPRGPEFWES